MKNILKWQIFGFLFSVVLGSLLHFVYDWSGKSIFVAPFSAVNESTWEHIKLFFIPAFLFALIQSVFLSNTYGNFWAVKLVGILLGLLLIPVLFYTYNGAFGKSPDWLNILFFVIATACAYLIEFLFFTKITRFSSLSVFAFILLCGIAFSFVIFTFFPPKLPIFKDQITNEYGINYSFK